MEAKYDKIHGLLSLGSYPKDYDRTQRQNLRRYASKFSLRDGELFFGTRRAIRGKEEARSIFEEFHASPMGGHTGIHKTRSALASRFYWFGMSVDIEKWIQECDQCQKMGKPLTAVQPLQCIKLKTSKPDSDPKKSKEKHKKLITSRPDSDLRKPKEKHKQNAACLLAPDNLESTTVHDFQPAMAAPCGSASVGNSWNKIVHKSAFTLITELGSSDQTAVKAEAGFDFPIVSELQMATLETDIKPVDEEKLITGLGSSDQTAVKVEAGFDFPIVSELQTATLETDIKPVDEEKLSHQPAFSSQVAVKVEAGFDLPIFSEPQTATLESDTKPIDQEKVVIDLRPMQLTTDRLYDRLVTTGKRFPAERVSSIPSTSQTLLGNHVGCQTDLPGRSSQGTQLSLRTLSPHVRSKGTQVPGSVSVEVGTTTTDAPWTTRCPLVSPTFKAPRPAKRPQIDVEEEDQGDLSTEVPEPQAPTDDPVDSVTVTVESSQFSSTEVRVNTEGLLKLFQFCWFCQRECCTTIEGNEKLFSISQDCKSCGYHRDWRSHPPTSLSSEEEASLSEEEEKKKRKRKSDSSDEWEPCLDEEATDSDVSMDEDLVTASKEDGEGELVVWCTQCETEASLSCSVLQHKKVFCCAQCRTGDDVQTHNFETLPVRFDDVASFQTHVEQEHGAKPFNILCQDCGKLVGAEKEHVCEHKIKFIVCPDCGKRFHNERGLKTHCTTLHSDYDHPCKYCLKVFKTKSAKLEHEQTHPKESQPYSCPDCPQKFSKIYKRNKHVKSHRGPHKCVCDVCNKGFKDIHRLRRHKLIHSGEKPFKCQVCERSFNQVVNLTSHMRVHTGEKPFLCEQCGESFSHKVSLKNHKQRHHDSGSTQEEEIMSDLEEEIMSDLEEGDV
ncbi:zinc finger protein 837-like isoform X8 [Neoarius graeffei]|uniref:zinc finger protein 837-like isoform X8 n=1 Tax=Neoarius graeffei TaxID=443677 RepID=UPI00298C3054|nr:zinc finger protein 837-like isoform X8 [Neoarius graeffei]